MKAKLRNFLVVSLLIFTPLILFSQVKKDKVKSMKVAYLTNELNLTPSESEKFWPIYNEMEEKLKSIRKEIKTSIDDMQNKSENMSEEDFKKNIQNILNSESQESNIKKEYLNKIAIAVGYKKTAKLMKAEKEFRTVLLNEMQDNKKPKNRPHN